MKLVVHWTKLLLLISLAVNVNGVDKLKESSELSESTWAKTWRRSHTLPRVLGNLSQSESTTATAYSMPTQERNLHLTKKSFVKYSKPEFENENTPKPAQISTIVNIKPDQSKAIRPIILNAPIIPNIERNTFDVSTTQTNYIKSEAESITEKPEIQSASNADFIERDAITSSGPVPIPAELSVMKLEQLSEPLLSNQSVNDHSEDVGSLSSPEFVPYSLSSSMKFEFKCEERNGFYGIENECDKFVECKDSEPNIYKCSRDLQFNVNAVWPSNPCEPPSIMNCKSNSILLSTEQTFSKPILMGSELNKYKCAVSEGYFRLEDSCDQFIVCKQFIASSYKCPPGLQFNRNTVFGDNPCAPNSVIRCEEHVQQDREPSFSTAMLIVSPMTDFVCPMRTGFYRLGNDCETFIKCEQNVASLYKCLTGLHFNIRTDANEDPCAAPSVAECNKEVKIKIKSSALLVDPNIDDYRCSEANGYFGIEDNCERFIECQLFVPSLYMCPNGLAFNKLAAWGEDPCSSSVYCEIKSTIAPIEQPGPTKSYTETLKHVPGYLCSGNGYFSVKDKCDHFIMCKQNVATLNYCTSGLHFNRNAAWDEDPCANPSIAHCELSESTKKPLSDESDNAVSGPCPRWQGYFPLDSNECSKYMRCEHGRAIIMPCPNGLVFNADLEACDWPVNVPSCHPEVFHSVTCPAPEVKEDGTPSDIIENFRYEQSCKKFIACQEGRPRLLTCNFGLSFSQESKSCIRSDFVLDCKD